MQESFWVPERVQTIYADKPAAVLRLLCSIIEGSEPQDALYAVASAVALADGPVRAAPIIRMHLESFDLTDERKGTSQREVFLRQVQGLIDDL